MEKLFKIKNLFLLLPALAFYYISAKNLAPEPTWDDYDAILKFLNHFTQANLTGKISLLFAQYGEHRLVPSKLLYIGYYYLTGGINFRVIGLIGDLQLLVVAFAGIHFLKKFDNWRFLAFLWMLLVFDLNTYENACMPMCACGNYGVVALFFGALYFYDKERYWPGVLLHILCVLSNANGLLAGVILIGFAGMQSRKKLLASLSALPVMVWYIATFHSEDLPGKMPFSLLRLLTFFIRQSGAHFSFDLSLYMGIAVIAVALRVIPYRKLLNQKTLPILAVFLFCAGTMVLAAIFRAPYKEAQFQTSRYLIYPQLAIACVLIFLFEKVRGKAWMIGVGVIMLVVYNLNFQFGKMGFERTNFRAETRAFWHPNPGEAERIARESCELNIYCIEDNR